VNLAESIIKKIEASAGSCEASFYALRAFLWSFFRPQTPKGWRYPHFRLGPNHPWPELQPGQHLSRDYWPPGHENPAIGFFWGVDQD